MDNYKFFENKECEYFPCHQSKKINCLFCFCPLYEKDCGGHYLILPNDIKDCSCCEIPHTERGYEYVIEKLKEARK